MLLDRIIRYIKGMLRITLRGAYCEQVLSILQRKNVTFYHLRRIDEQTVSVMVMEKDFSVIQAVCSRYYMEPEVKHTSSFRTIRQRLLTTKKLGTTQSIMNVLPTHVVPT